MAALTISTANLCSVTVLFEHTTEVIVHGGCLLGGRGFHSGSSMLARVYNETSCCLLKWRYLSPGHLCWLFKPLKKWITCQLLKLCGDTSQKRGKPTWISCPQRWMGGLTTQCGVGLWAEELFLCFLVSWWSGRMSHCIAASLWDPESIPWHLCNYVPRYNPLCPSQLPF